MRTCRAASSSLAVLAVLDGDRLFFRIFARHRERLRRGDLVDGGRDTKNLKRAPAQIVAAAISGPRAPYVVHGFANAAAGNETRPGSQMRAAVSLLLATLMFGAWGSCHGESDMTLFDQQWNEMKASPSGAVEAERLDGLVEVARSRGREIHGQPRRRRDRQPHTDRRPGR
jgi:hypothetical protein